MRITNRVVGISGVASAASANIPLDVNRRYHTIKIKTYSGAYAAAVASAVIDTIRVKVNETTVWEITAAALLKFNAAIGLPDPTGIITLHFSRPDLADIINEEATAFDMFGERSFRIEVVLQTVTTPTLEAVSYYDFKPNVNQTDGSPAKIILRLFSYTDSFTANEFKDWTTLNKTRPILRVFLDAPGGTIDDVQVIADDLNIFEAKPLENAAMLTNYDISSTAGPHKFIIAFNFTNRLDDSLLVGKSLNFRIKSSLNQNVTALMETLSLGFNG